MNSEERDMLQRLGSVFQIDGEFREAHRIKIGHINETFAVTYTHGGRVVRKREVEVAAGGPVHGRKLACHQDVGEVAVEAAGHESD